MKTINVDHTKIFESRIRQRKVSETKEDISPFLKVITILPNYVAIKKYILTNVFVLKGRENFSTKRFLLNYKYSKAVA